MNYDRVILELLDRVSALEEKIEQIQAFIKTDGVLPNEKILWDKTVENPAVANSRDTTKYIFEGKRYGKNRLVLAVVQKYVQMNLGISAERLMLTFDRSIQGSLGVVRVAEEAKYGYADHARRFFFRPSEIIHTSTDDCVVCTQWGKFNIGNFITRAEQLGMNIQAVGGVENNSNACGDKMNSAFAVGQLIGQDTFMELYYDELQSLYDDPMFMSFIDQLRKKLNGLEVTNTKVANTEIMNAFYYANINEKYREVAEIVERVKKYGKQASAHISIYYAMYILDYQ